MPYIPEISVNSAYNRGDPKQGLKPEVDEWLILLKCKLNKELKAREVKALCQDAGVQLDIELKIPTKRGRKPDVSNFRKIPQDLIASVLGVDDWIFSGQDYPIARGTGDILFYISWYYSSNHKDILDMVQSDLHNGPLTKDVRDRLGLGNGQYCIGFGTPYCMRCDIECPVEFYPGCLVEIPCKTCNIKCPCRAMDDDYKDREQRILAWWRRQNGKI
jgi:hypothetical protein